MSDKLYLPKDISISGDFYLNPHNAGREACDPGKHFGPFVRSYYLIHYIIGGKGIFDDGKNVYTLTAGEAFLICPDKITFYQADIDDPWEYIWFTFGGEYAKSVLEWIGLSGDNPIYKTADGKKITKSVEALFALISSSADKHRVLGAFFTLVGDMRENGVGRIAYPLSVGRDYVNRAKDYVRGNDHRKITVEELCRAVGIERSYLYRLFMEYENKSPKEYILSFKMARAAQYLKNQEFNLSEIARSVGFEDIAAFSKTFKRLYSLPPREYRKKYCNTPLRGCM